MAETNGIQVLTDHSNDRNRKAGDCQCETELWNSLTNTPGAPVGDNVAPVAGELLSEDTTNDERYELKTDLPRSEMEFLAVHLW